MRITSVLTLALAAVALALTLAPSEALAVGGLPWPSHPQVPREPESNPVEPAADQPSSTQPADGSKPEGKKKGYLKQEAEKEPAYRAFLLAVAYIRDAQIHLAKAFGLKDLVATLEAEKFAIENPSTISPPDGKKQLESSLAANEAIGERMEQQQVLSAEGKKEYEASLDPYSAGMHETVLLAPQVLDLSAGLGKSLTGGVAGLAGGISKGSAAGFLIKEFRPFYKEMRKTFRQIASFAKVQAIPIPADATAALGSLPEDEVGDNLAILMLERLELVVDGTFGADTLIAAAAAPTPVVASVAGSQVASEGAAVPAAEIAAEPVRVVAMSAAAAPPPTSPPPSASPALAPSTPRAPMPTAVIARAADPLPAALEPPPPRITSRQPLSRELDGP